MLFNTADVLQAVNFATSYYSFIRLVSSHVVDVRFQIITENLTEFAATFASTKFL